jgi:hypothetical protein
MDWTMPELRAMRIRAGIEPSQKLTPKERTTIFGRITKTIKMTERRVFFTGRAGSPGDKGGRGRNQGQRAAPSAIPVKLRRYIATRIPAAAGDKKSKRTKLRYIINIPQNRANHADIWARERQPIVFIFIFREILSKICLFS